MVYFLVTISENELENLRDRLDANQFCVFEIDATRARYCGIISDHAYPHLKEQLSSQAVGELELLTFEQFDKISGSFKKVNSLIGNTQLVYYT